MGTAPTFIAGEVVTVGDLAFLADPPHASARSTSNQSVATSSFVPIALQAEVEDNDAMFTPGASSMTIKTAGRWRITFAVSWVTNGTGARAASLWVNGAEAARQYTPTNGGGQGVNLIGTAELRCALNDVIQLRGLQNSGGNLDAYGAAPPNADACWLTATWIGK